jgi:hypothetical protein
VRGHGRDHVVVAIEGRFTKIGLRLSLAAVLDPSNGAVKLPNFDRATLSWDVDAK